MVDEGAGYFPADTTRIGPVGATMCTRLHTAYNRAAKAFRNLDLPEPAGPV